MSENTTTGTGGTTGPLACIFELDPTRSGMIESQLASLLAGVVEDEGRSLRVLCAENRDTDDVLKELKSHNPSGIIVDSSDMELLSQILQLPIPAVIVNNWAESLPIDTVVQDDFQGGLFAARYLASRGHKSIAWIGPKLTHVNMHLRLSGAETGLREIGIGFKTPECPVIDYLDMAETIPRLLDGKKHPTAFLTLWCDMAIQFAKIVREKGLTIGKDIDMVGWCREEQYDGLYREAFVPGPAAPAVVWNVADMAALALSRLHERRRSPNTPHTHTRIPVRLKFDEA